MISMMSLPTDGTLSLLLGCTQETLGLSNLAYWRTRRTRRTRKAVLIRPALGMANSFHLRHLVLSPLVRRGLSGCIIHFYQRFLLPGLKAAWSPPGVLAVSIRPEIQTASTSFTIILRLGRALKAMGSSPWQLITRGSKCNI
jgi:hypothetical protein